MLKVKKDLVHELGTDVEVLKVGKKYVNVRPIVYVGLLLSYLNVDTYGFEKQPLDFWHNMKLQDLNEKLYFFNSNGTLVAKWSPK